MAELQDAALELNYFLLVHGQLELFYYLDRHLFIRRLLDSLVD